MCARIIQIDLPETPNPMSDVPRFLLESAQKKSGLLPLDLLIKRDLGTGEEAHGHLGFSNRGESVCRGAPKFR
jgi:hypothetical protein